VIRRQTRDGRLLVAQLLAIVNGDFEAGTRDRIAAARVLLEWGFSRPPAEAAVQIGMAEVTWTTLRDGTRVPAIDARLIQEILSGSEPAR